MKRSPKRRRRSISAATKRVLDLHGREALQTLVPPDIAIDIVLEDRLSDALAGAMLGHKRAPKSSPSLINAYAYLGERVARLAPAALAKARKARRALVLAQKAYDDAVAPISKVIYELGDS